MPTSGILYAAAAVVDPGLLTTERADIAVVTEDGPDSGRTIRSDAGFPIDVATDADAARLEELLLRTLDGVPPDEALVEPPPPVGEAVVTYDGTNCTYDGPTDVAAGRMEFRFDSNDSTWVAAVAHLTGDLTFDEILAWIEANPSVQEPPPGVGEVDVVPPGVVTYIDVRAPGVGWSARRPDLASYSSPAHWSSSDAGAGRVQCVRPPFYIRRHGRPAR